MNPLWGLLLGAFFGVLIGMPYIMASIDLEKARKARDRKNFDFGSEQ